MAKKNFLSYLLFVFLILGYYSPFAAEKGAVDLWIMPNGANPQGVMNELLLEFQKESGIKVNLTILDWGESWGRIHEVLERGDGPHVLQLGTTWVPYFANRGWLTPMENLVDDLAFSRFVNVSLNTTKIYGKPEIYAVPWFADVRVLMANKKYLDHYGIKAEDIKDWRGFRRVLQKIQENPIVNQEGLNVDGYAFPGKSDWNIPHNFAPWVWSEGGDFLVASGGKWQSKLLEPATVRGIRRYIGFVLDSLAARSTLKMNTSSVSQKFNNSEQVFVLKTSETIMQTRILAKNGGLQDASLGLDGIESFPVPMGEAGSVAFIGGSNLAIPKKHSKDANAIALLKFLTRGDMLDSYNSQLGFLPADRNILKKWLKDPLYAPVVKALESGKTYPNIPEWGNIEATLVEMFTAIWSLVDVKGFYSEKELYEILLRYDIELNRMLQSPENSNHPSYVTFLTYLDSNVQSEAFKQDEIEEKTFPPILMGGMVLLVLLLLVAWKKTKE